MIKTAKYNIGAVNKENSLCEVVQDGKKVFEFRFFNRGFNMEFWKDPDKRIAYLQRFGKVLAESIRAFKTEYPDVFNANLLIIKAISDKLATYANYGIMGVNLDDLSKNPISPEAFLATFLDIDKFFKSKEATDCYLPTNWELEQSPLKQVSRFEYVEQMTKPQLRQQPVQE